MNIDEPIRNDLLLELIGNSNDISLTKDIVNEILKAHFLCPVYGESKHLYSISDGMNRFLIAFTDWDEYYKWNSTCEQPQGLVMTYYDYLKILNLIDVMGFVINPYGCNLIIDNQRIEYINKQSNVIKKGDKIAVGKPKEKPVELIDGLIKFFKTLDCVNQGYLLWMVRNNEASYLLVLDADEEEQSLFPQIAEVSKPFLSGKLLDMIPVNSSFGKTVIENQVPFYSK